jgi:hypothetical protein
VQSAARGPELFKAWRGGTGKVLVGLMMVVAKQ